MFEEIPRDQYKFVAWRMCAGTMMGYFSIYAISILPLVEVSLILSTAPLFTLVFSYFLLRDKLTVIEFFCLVLSFSGVMSMILGDNTTGEEESHYTKTEYYLAFAFILMVPIMMAFSAIAIRHMRYLHPNVSGFYTCFTGMTAMSILVFATGKNYNWLGLFGLTEWIMFLFLGMIHTMSGYWLSYSAQLDTPARNQLYSYLAPVLQFFFDMTILNTDFNEVQVVGIVLIFLADAVLIYERIKMIKMGLIKPPPGHGPPPHGHPPKGLPPPGQKPMLGGPPPKNEK